MNHKIAQLILTPGKNASKVCDIFVAQIDAYKEQLAGKLFILIETESNGPTGLKLINFLIDSLNRNYYQNEKILLRERISALKIEHIFEAALARTNKNFAEHLKNAKINQNKLKLNIVAGIIHEKNIYLSGTGSGSAFLIYRGNENENNNQYKATDILARSEKTENGKKTETTDKIFSSVINGTLPPQSYLLLSNEALPEYISKKQMIETVTLLPPSGAAAQLKQILCGVNAYVSFLGLIIKSPEIVLNQINKTANIEKKSAQESIINLNQTENNTENLLSGSGMAKAGKLLGFLRGLFEKGNKKTGISINSSFGLKDKILFKRKDSFFSKIPLVFKMFGNILQYGLRAIVSLAGLIKSKSEGSKISETGKNLANNARLLPTRVFSGLSAKRKLLLLLIILVLGALLTNLLLHRNTQKQQAAEKDYSETISQIEQKQNQAEANMLFSNEERAMELYGEILLLIESLPQKSEEQIQQHSEFTEKYEDFLERSRRIFPFNNMEKLIVLNDLLPEADADNVIFDSVSKKIYAADSKLKSIYIFDIQNKLGTILSGLDLQIEKLEHPVILEDGRVFYFNDKGLIIFNSRENRLTSAEINLNDAEAAASDVYNNRLYVLDKTNKQIYRYALNALNAPSAWIQDNSALENMNGLSIDGNIFVSTESAEVIKYLQGEKLNFRLETIDPPLQKADKIVAQREGDLVYILDSAENRVVVYDKNGQFQKQYREKDFSEIKDFSIDEKEKILYFLAGNSIYKASLDAESE